ncbi:MAG: 30S ribosomal protein S17 [Dehalococcoidia bacterium]|nr:30S ribosomal protein S17 [Dehalococcoidia bacterium]
MANVKSMVGLVVSTKMNKTVVVAVEKQKQHSLYHKTYRIMVKYLAHDEREECKLDDKVRIVETRPLSKLKRWRVAEILSRGDVPEVKPEEVI